MNSKVEYIIHNENVGNINLVLLENTLQDYNLVKDILTDKEIMETSTIFNRNISNDELKIKYIFDLFLSRNELTKKIGIFKILLDNTDEVIGIAGFTPLVPEKTEILEYGILLKEKFQSIHIGTDVTLFLLNLIKNKVNNILLTTFIDNKKCINLCKKANFKFYSSFQKEKNLISIYSLNSYKIQLAIDNLLTLSICK